MEIIATHFDAVHEIATPRFGDERGSFSVTFNADTAAKLGLPSIFVQDNHSISAPVGTLRGMHYQVPPAAQGKLVRVTAGRILDVFVDLRPDSATLGQYGSVEVSAEAGNQVWVPKGFAHGFCTLEPDTEVVYKVDARWAPDAERSLAWDDPTVGIEWPVDPASVTLSAKDADGLSYADALAEISAAPSWDQTERTQP